MSISAMAVQVQWWQVYDACESEISDPVQLCDKVDYFFFLLW